MSAAIEVRDVSKKFRINHERHQSLKERVVRFGRRSPSEDFWALRDIEFDVEEGETVGLLGHNGSGKSTLLKCVGGILQPTAGEIRTRGRLASLLELGAGFHPDLTGRENVFLNAQILGLKTRDIETRFDEIVEFAELEQFIDQQVKHYSSGMYVRLGFAVATNVDPDVLLVDEVLAVGDEAFQRKCLERVRLFQRQGRTIVFVTHAADLVRQICDRAVVLNHGEMIDVGPPGEAIRTFRESLNERVQLRDSTVPAEPIDAGLVTAVDEPAHEEAPAAAAVPRPGGNGEVQITDVRMEYPQCDERPYLLPNEPLTIAVRYHARRRVDDVVFAINVHDVEGRLVYGANTDVLHTDPGSVEGDGWLRFEFERVPLLDGSYAVTLGIHSHDIGTIYDHHDADHRFQVMNPGQTVGQVEMAASIVLSESVRQEAG